MLPFDLHVLGLPPAFNLSHDQTLHFKFFSWPASHWLSISLTCHWLLRFSLFFSPSLSVPTQIVFTVLLKNFTFLPWQRVHILQPFFFFAIPFLIFFSFFRSFAHFTHCFVWSSSNLTFVLFTFYAILSLSTLFSRPFGRPLIPFSFLLTVQFLAFWSKFFAYSGSNAVFSRFIYFKCSPHHIFHI